MKRGVALFFIAAGTTFAANVGTNKPTYSKDVAPILNSRCVECHRAGEIGPMALTNYREVRPWAKSIKERVVSRAMPPWLADAHYGQFRNDRSMPQKEIDTLVSWVDAGSPEGDPKDVPAAPKFEEGWDIPKPDVTFDIGQDYAVPAEGTVAYQYFRVPTNFTEDKWIQAAEIRPTNRAATHHVIVFVAGPGEKGIGGGGQEGNLLVGIGPGEQPMVFEPGVAKLVKAGSTFVFQMHFTPNGKAFTDRTYVGLKFASEPPKYRADVGMAVQFNFKIPAGDPSYEVHSTWTAKKDVELVSLMPHMHKRGKDFKYTATYPDGRQEVLLNVPKYDFNWQLTYDLKEKMTLPVGTRIDCVAHFDNSPNNKYNPDPTKDVRWGDQTWEEMMIGFFTYLTPNVPAAATSATGH
jgi:hypothetical protein